MHCNASMHWCLKCDVVLLKWVQYWQSACQAAEQSRAWVSAGSSVLSRALPSQHLTTQNNFWWNIQTKLSNISLQTVMEEQRKGTLSSQRAHPSEFLSIPNWTPNSQSLCWYIIVFSKYCFLVGGPSNYFYYLKGPWKSSRFDTRGSPVDLFVPEILPDDFFVMSSSSSNSSSRSGGRNCVF